MNWHGKKVVTFSQTLSSRMWRFIQAIPNSALGFAYQSIWHTRISTLIVLLFLAVPSKHLVCHLAQEIKRNTDNQSLFAIVADILAIGSLVVIFANYWRGKVKFAVWGEKFRNALLRELQTVSKFYESIQIDAEESKFVQYLNQKLRSQYIDKFMLYEQFGAIGRLFYEDFAYFTARFHNLTAEKRIFIEINIFSIHYELRHEYLQSIARADFTSADSPYRRALLLIGLHSKGQLKDVNTFAVESLKDDDSSALALHRDIILTEGTKLAGLMSAPKTEGLAKSILSHVIGESYSIVAVSKTKNDLIDGPCLIIKNEEAFDSWWTKIDRKGRECFRVRNPKAKDEEVEAYSIKKIIEKDFKSEFPQPFSSSLAEDSFIERVLDHNKRAPIYVLNANSLPIQYRRRPIEYINRVIRPRAEKKQKKLIARIKKIEPRITGVEKELMFNYELIPFDLHKAQIIARPDKTPKSFERMYLEEYITKENRGRFAEAHILQIRRILKKISPISLIVAAASEEMRAKLRKIETIWLAGLEKRKYGIKFEGVEDIIENAKNAESLSTTLYLAARKSKIKITKAESQSIVAEILKNAKIIQDAMAEKIKT